MNCDTIDSILDARRSAELAAAESQNVATHLAACARCADAWAAHDALSRESMGGPPAELWAQVLGRVAAVPEVRPAVPRGARYALVGLAAAAAVAIVIAARVLFPVAEPAADSVADARVDVLAEPAFVAGRDYLVLASPAPAARAPDKVAVVEFFMYHCFPCFAFEDELVRWGSQAQDHVALTRVPAVFDADAELQARAFYSAELLGKLDEMHGAFYDEIHARGNPLASRAALAEFFARFGVGAAEFVATFDSSEVDSRVRRAIALGAQYRVRATPTIVVAGRYVTSPSLAGADTLAVVEQLVAAQLPASPPSGP